MCLEVKPNSNSAKNYKARNIVGRQFKSKHTGCFSGIDRQVVFLRALRSFVFVCYFVMLTFAGLEGVVNCVIWDQTARHKLS